MIARRNLEPGLRLDEAVRGQQLRDLAREVQVPILFGSDQTVFDPPGTQSESTERHYNAAFQLAPDGNTAVVYRKIHLVPFGEFVPMADWLTFFPPLVQTLAGFAPFTPGQVDEVWTHHVPA